MGVIFSVEFAGEDYNKINDVWYKFICKEYNACDCYYDFSSLSDIVEEMKSKAEEVYQKYDYVMLEKSYSGITRV